MGTQGHRTSSLLVVIIEDGEVVDFAEVEGRARQYLAVHKSLDPGTREATGDSWRVTHTLAGLSVIPREFSTFKHAKRVRDALVESGVDWEPTPPLSAFETSVAREYLRDMALEALCRIVIRRGTRPRL